MCDCADLFTQAPSIAARKSYQKVIVTSFLSDGYVTLMVYSFARRVFRIFSSWTSGSWSDCCKTLDLEPDHYAIGFGLSGTLVALEVGTCDRAVWHEE